MEQCKFDKGEEKLCNVEGETNAQQEGIAGERIARRCEKHLVGNMHITSCANTNVHVVANQVITAGENYEAGERIVRRGGEYAVQQPGAVNAIHTMVM